MTAPNHFTAAELDALAASVVPPDVDPDSSEYTCKRCSVEYYVDEPDINDPSAMCDHCAHAFVENDGPRLIAQARRAIELESRNEHQVGRIEAMGRSHRAELAELDAKAEAAEARIAELETQLAEREGLAARRDAFLRKSRAIESHTCADFSGSHHVWLSASGKALTDYCAGPDYWQALRAALDEVDS